MISFKFIVLVLCCLLIEQTICARKIPCGVNEQFSECMRPIACQRGCPQRIDQGKVCITSCISGCKCKRGYLRNSKNECVRYRFCS